MIPNENIRKSTPVANELITRPPNVRRPPMINAILCPNLSIITLAKGPVT